MITKIIKYYVVVLLLSLIFPVIADARLDYTVFPRLSIEGRYSDNYYNREIEKDDALIATISPGILLSVMTQNILLDLDYSLNAAGYFIRDEENRYEYYNQRGFANFRANLSRNISVLLRDEIIKNLDTLLIDENLTRQERMAQYIMNTAGGELIYRYAEGSEIGAGYSFTLVEYLDSNIDDSERHNFTGRISRSFNIRNIGNINYRHSIVDYRRVGGAGQVSREDIYEDEIRGRFTHFFTPRFSGGLNYGYIETHYDGATVDYHIHDATLESVYNITPYLTADGRFGMYFREQYNRENKWEEGLVYRAGLTYTYPTFTGSAAYEGGYNSVYTNPQMLEFFRYWRVAGEAMYHLIREKLTLRGRGYYTVNNYPNSLNNREDHVWNAGGGIDYQILNWLLFALEYGHTVRNSNLPGFHYTENIYIARITISYRISTMERDIETRERRERERRIETGVERREMERREREEDNAR